jgi:UDP-N-acetylglucosamine:LPS N-acetylglucosamine transferase/quercetin dioxygenase-like cupin family protein
MTTRPRAAVNAPSADILILTSSTGAGHDSVASALQEAVHELAPEVGVYVFDALCDRSQAGPLSLGRWYDATVEYASWLWRLFYRATNSEGAVRLGMAAGGLLWARRLRSVLRTQRPKLVVSVHPLCTRLAAGILRSMPDAPPLHCVVTDMVTIHRCWVCAEVAAFYVATSNASTAVAALGIPRERIHVTGLPLRAAFAQQPQPLPPDDTTRVLLLGSGRPARRIEQVARALVAASLPLHLIVVCGRNARLQYRLNRILGARATVHGWRDDIAALMRWSNVVVTKGGPTAVAEALSQARPVLIFQVLEDQETGNAALVERTGAGRYLPDVDALVRAIAASPQGLPTVDPTQAMWLGRAARRVAKRTLTALRRCPAPDTSSPLADHEDSADLSAHVIYNPLSGERIIIRQSGEQTAGQLLTFDHFMPPSGHVPARHVHPNQEERFTIIEGQMRFRLGWRRSFIANPGDTVVVPPGTAHWFGNAGEGVSHARVEVRPALRLQEVFERSAALEVVERFPGVRLPRLSELAPLMLEFQRELAVPDVPAFLVTAFLSPFVWLGRWRSHDANHGSPG